MRTIRIILIVLVLIGFPALSWYYLSSGLKWRITAQDETEKKVRLQAFTIVQPDSQYMSEQDLMGVYYVVALPRDSASVSHLEMVNSQFHVRKDFRMLYLATDDSSSVPIRIDSSWIRARCVSGCGAMGEALFGKDYSGAIVDDSLYVRGRYHLSSVKEMRKLVEHLAVVLPIEKRERIELKRGNQ